MLNDQGDAIALAPNQGGLPYVFGELFSEDWRYSKSLMRLFEFNCMNRSNKVRSKKKIDVVEKEMVTQGCLSLQFIWRKWTLGNNTFLLTEASLPMCLSNFRCVHCFYDRACLLNRNGSGKSHSLIDAMVWSSVAHWSADVVRREKDPEAGSS